MINIYEIFEKPMIENFSFYGNEGIKIDNKFLKSLSLNLKKKLKKFKKKFLKYLKKEFNIASPKQLGEILYNDLKNSRIEKN